MAIAWLSALKIIPWSDVIEATPGIVKRASKIFARSQQTEVPASAEASDGTALQARVALLEASLTQLAEQQRATAQLVETLAQQNARVVQAIDVLRLRTRVLMAASGVLAVLLAAAVWWGAR